MEAKFPFCHWIYLHSRSAVSAGWWLMPVTAMFSRLTLQCCLLVSIYLISGCWVIKQTFWFWSFDDFTTNAVYEFTGKSFWRAKKLSKWLLNGSSRTEMLFSTARWGFNDRFRLKICLLLSQKTTTSSVTSYDRIFLYYKLWKLSWTC